MSNVRIGVCPSRHITGTDRHLAWSIVSHVYKCGNSNMTLQFLHCSCREQWTALAQTKFIQSSTMLPPLYRPQRYSILVRERVWQSQTQTQSLSSPIRIQRSKIFLHIMECVQHLLYRYRQCLTMSTKFDITYINGESHLNPCCEEVDSFFRFRSPQVKIDRRT